MYRKMNENTLIGENVRVEKYSLYNPVSLHIDINNVNSVVSLHTVRYNGLRRQILVLYVLMFVEI